MPNRLADSASPYLLQHQDNPVDWFEWGDEAFTLARSTDRPVLLSVGYSACHWCHVMAHESFEDDETAAYMNEHFVNVKVDREERPDIDRIYMDALQTMTGHGGWPMSVFLTPDGGPFYAGTYYPKEARGHMPSFRQVLEGVTNAWSTNRDQLQDQANRLTAAVRAGIPADDAPDANAAIETAIATLAQSFDAEWGGFGGAPKFPQAPVLEFLLRARALDPARSRVIDPILRRTLDAMRSGGIYDQIGGGFSRYSVDTQWLIPHFEKMLYDNALLARVYLRAGQVLGEPRYTDTAQEILDYLAGEMRDPAGGIHAAEDADSEGVEGKYYVWSFQEFLSIAGEDAEVVGQLYGVTPTGNFEGANNLHLAVNPESVAASHDLDPAEVAAAKQRVDKALLEARGSRVRPGRDDKVIAAWNGLALQAFAEAAGVLDSPSYRETAIGIARFLTRDMTREDGRLMRSWRQGRLSGPGFCIDYAATALGLFTLFQVTGDQDWYREAARLTGSMVDLFGSDDGFHSTGIDQPGLIARPRDFMDNPLPSANSLAAESLNLLAAYTGSRSEHLDGITRGAARLMDRAPHAVPHLLSVLHAVESGIKEIAIIGRGEERRQLEAVVWDAFRPNCVLASGDGTNGDVPLLINRGTAGAAAAAHVCRNFACDLPVTTADDLRRLLPK